MEQAPPTPPRRRQPQTIWRLVDAKCDQISDAVSAVRLPFVFALTLSIIWLSALYISEYGYTQYVREEIVKVAAVGRINLVTPARPEDVQPKDAQPKDAQPKDVQPEEPFKRRFQK